MAFFSKITLMTMSTLIAFAALSSCVTAQVISDIETTSIFDERRALEFKAEAFWQAVHTAAENMKMEEHLTLYADVEAVLVNLPQENTYVRDALKESLELLQRADKTVLSQGIEASQLSAEKLAAPAGGAVPSAFNFFTAGQNFISQVLRRFVEGSNYSAKSNDHVGQRQADILPVLRGAASVTGNVLKDCRLASQRAFDVWKYDIYNKDVPKTPKEAVEVSKRLVDAVGQTRHRFTSFITDTANGIARDTETKSEGATATVMRSTVDSTASYSYSYTSFGGNPVKLPESFGVLTEI